MGNYNVHEAKSNLSRRLQKATAWEQVIITRDGKPAAELLPYRERSRKRRVGFAAGPTAMAEGWERPTADAETEAFLGGRL